MVLFLEKMHMHIHMYVLTMYVRTYVLQWINLTYHLRNLVFWQNLMQLPNLITHNI